MWPFKKKQIEFNMCRDDKTVDGRKCFIIGAWPTSEIAATYNASRNQCCMCDGLFYAHQKYWRITREIKEESFAEIILKRNGYRDCSGRLWKPPLGCKPEFLKQKGIKMKNKHPHYDLIVEYIADINKTFQTRFNGKWEDCGISVILDDLKGNHTFRVKMREFQKGHWYPCFYQDREFMCKFNGLNLIEPVNHAYHVHHVHNITWSVELKELFVGKSLGEIEFGGEE